MGSITLESTEASFQKWREQRSNRTELIPEYLWSMALALYPQYNRAKICRQLRLSGGQFKQRLEGVSPKFADTGFVLASSDEIKTNPSACARADVQLAIQGKERALTFSVGVDVLLQILPYLGALL